MPSSVLAVVADKSIEEVLKCLLKRYHAFGTAPLLQDFRVFRIPKMTDGAILKRSHLYLIDARHNETAALVICDRHGSGAGGSREELEARIEANIRQSGAFSQCCAIVIDPELENWIWTKSPRLDQAIGWNHQPKLRHWLVQEGLMGVDAVKPTNPKLALERALQYACIPWASAIHAEVAAKVSFQDCTDPAFLKLWNTLKLWFPST